MRASKNYWAQNSSHTLIESNSKCLLKITKDGRIYWNNKEVETDDELRTAMIDLNKNIRSCATATYYCNNELFDALQGLLSYFKSGNSVPVERATIKADSAEVKAAFAAIAKAEGVRA